MAILALIVGSLYLVVALWWFFRISRSLTYSTVAILIAEHGERQDVWMRRVFAIAWPIDLFVTRIVFGKGATRRGLRGSFCRGAVHPADLRLVELYREQRQLLDRAGECLKSIDGLDEATACLERFDLLEAEETALSAG